MKPTLKAPGIKRLKLEYDELLSSFGFKFNMRRYTMEEVHETETTQELWVCPDGQRLGVAVQVDPIKPKLKAPGTKRLKP
jgi:hypothetical protein